MEFLPECTKGNAVECCLNHCPEDFFRSTFDELRTQGMKFHVRGCAPEAIRLIGKLAKLHNFFKFLSFLAQGSAAIVYTKQNSLKSSRKILGKSPDYEITKT